VITVTHADDETVILASRDFAERFRYDEDSWLDMIQQIRNEYWKEENGCEKICDVSHAVLRAEELAKTPMEKAHTKAAVSVVRRIMETDPEFNPDHTATGHWNFFSKSVVYPKNNRLNFTHNHRWSFEWKCMSGSGDADTPLLYNDILGILQDAANCIWSDEWCIGASPIVEYDHYGNAVRTHITCDDGGTITTKAGTFENCLKLSMDIEGMKDGLAYRGGRKVYYFAEGIGIVRTENEYCEGVRTAVYELTFFEGTGEGYMPMADGLVRRYDAIGLTDGYVGAVEYTYVQDDAGHIVIFMDATGIRELPPPMTQYSMIQGEVIEQQLWDEGNWKEGHMKYAANNFHLILHLLARPSRNRNNAKRSIEINGFYMNIMELLGENGEVPPAWYSLYAWTALIKSAALFGDGKKERGYASLDVAVNFCEKISLLKAGELLDTGNEELLGGVKYEYTKGVILLPDGSKEPVSYDYRMDFDVSNLVYCLTAPHGWEWFDSVREEDRFKEYIERAKKLMESKPSKS